MYSFVLFYLHRLRSCLFGVTKGDTKGSGWFESPEVCSNKLVQGCRRINSALQELMGLVYMLIYSQEGSGTRRGPNISIPVAPVLPYELLQPMFDAKLLDDQAYSYIFEASLGFPVSKDAYKSREERHQALHLKPFLKETGPKP